MDALEAKGFIPPELVETEVQWFYTALGIDGGCNRLCMHHSQY